MPHPGFKSESGLSKFLCRDLSRTLGRPSDDCGDAAAICEQTPLVLRLEAYISETGEMQHLPEPIASVREIMARNGGARSRIEAAENHVEAFSEDIRFIPPSSGSVCAAYLFALLAPAQSSTISKSVISRSAVMWIMTNRSPLSFIKR